MDVIVNIASAVICVASSCYPVLVGNDTPKGEYQLTHYSIEDKKYGGDILVFKIEGQDVYAIHRVIDVPSQQRPARLKSPYPKHRVTITYGCINVEPEVFQELIRCCSTSKMIVK